MSIWEHRASGRNKSQITQLVHSSLCPFCSVDCLEADKYKPPLGGRKPGGLTGRTLHIGVCPSCGWWRAWGNEGRSDRNFIYHEEYGEISVLRKFDINSGDEPLINIRDYISTKRVGKSNLSPFLFEDAVGSVFSSMGFKVRGAGYMNDGGIDLVLNDGSNVEIAVQVKMRKDKVSVNYIREFVGAIILGEQTKGIFVTLSDFTKPSKQAAEDATLRGVPIELMNGTEFLKSLDVVQTTIDREIDRLRDSLFHRDLCILNKNRFAKR